MNNFYDKLIQHLYFSLLTFLVTQHRPAAKETHKTEQREKVGCQVAETASFEV